MQTQVIDCHCQNAIDLIGDRWILTIIRQFHEEQCALRFNQLMSLLEPINSRTLSVKLKDLQERGIIEKNIVSTTPLVANYSLTTKGLDLKKVINDLTLWSEKWH